MQKKKTEIVDSAMCDRFVKVWLSTGLSAWEFARLCGLEYPSMLSEIKNHVIEPSKMIVMSLYHNLGISPNYILIGVGDMTIRKPPARSVQKSG